MQLCYLAIQSMDLPTTNAKNHGNNDLRKPDKTRLHRRMFATESNRIPSQIWIGSLELSIKVEEEPHENRWEYLTSSLEDLYRRIPIDKEHWL